MAHSNMFRLVTWSLVVPIVLFYVLSLVGCISTSPGIPDIYLLKLSTTTSPHFVNVGYFGMCAGTNTTVPVCLPSFSLGLPPSSSSDPSSSSSTNIFNTTSPELTRLIDLGHEVQVKVIFFVPLLLASVLFFVSAGLLVVWRQAAHKMSPAAAGIAITLHVVALSMLLAAATAVSMVVNALHFAVVEVTRGQNEINIAGGTALQTFQWLTVVFSFAWQVCVMRCYNVDDRRKY